MVFSSLLFLFLFLSSNLAVYYLVRPRWRNTVLLIWSLIFYGWSGPQYLLLLLGLVAVTWFLTLQIERDRKAGRRGKGYLVLDLAVLLLVLGVFKYTGFFMENLRLLTGVPEEIPQIVLPLGISFYTFQLISYTVDVYRGETAAQRSYAKLLLYAGLFHQCVAGPIVRYQTVAGEIEHRQATAEDVSEGIRRFSVGLAKKALLANGCARAADTLLPDVLSAVSGSTQAGLWLGMLFYMMQIYLDFSAYSDMAIGMGRMVGFHYLENFNYPYMADSVRGFWRRWHISLSTFFRDYIYIPMGGSKVSLLKWVRNIIVVWFLTGMWHGASWNFILWGLYFAVFLLLEKPLRRMSIPRIARHIYLLIVVYFGWVLFRFDDMQLLGAVLGGMFGQGLAVSDMATSVTFMNHLFFMIFCLIACTPLGRRIRQWMIRRESERPLLGRIVAIGDMILPVLLLILSVCALVGSSYNPFLYFRF